MKIIIVGMGIIGGSYAKALKKYTNHTVVGINRSKEPLNHALSVNAIDKIGTSEDLKDADIIILCVYPAAAVEFIKTHAKIINPNCIVTDTSGIKKEICPQMLELSKKYGFDFVGGHPMAGKEKNGFAVSEADLFKNASFILVPCKAKDSSVKTIKDLAAALKFGGVRFASAEEHDRMIAYTSQLPHALACAYVLSPSCPKHKGFSAGSYKDVSRVANINAELWAELFLENKENLLLELNILIENLNSIKTAVNNESFEELSIILNKGKSVKEALGE